MSPRWMTALLGALSVAGCGAPPPRVDPEAPTPREAQTARSPLLARAAVLGPTRVMAFGPSGLYVTRGGRWTSVGVRGVALLDVQAARGAFWVLARGVDAQAGNLLVLRASGVDDLTVAHAAADRSTAPTAAMVVERPGSYLVGGESMPLHRLRPGGSDALDDARTEPIERLRLMPDELVVIERRGAPLSAWRWGGWRTVRPDLAVVFAGMRASLGLGRDGSAWRGLPWERPSLGNRVGAASDIVPAFGATLRDGRIVAIAADGATRVLDAGGWSPVDRAPAPLATVEGGADTRGAVVAVARDGVVSVLSEGRRWVETVPRIADEEPR